MSFGVPYLIVRNAPYVFLSFHLEALVEATEVNGPACSPNLAANGAETELRGAEEVFHNEKAREPTWYGTAELDCTLKRTAPQ